jgi:hypothetical protein
MGKLRCHTRATLPRGRLLAEWYLDMRWQDATLLALALLTSSTGFIIDSLDRFGLGTEERFWVTNNAISGELLALAIMFVVLKATDPVGLATATGVLALSSCARLSTSRPRPLAPGPEVRRLRCRLSAAPR